MKSFLKIVDFAEEFRYSYYDHIVVLYLHVYTLHQYMCICRTAMDKNSVILAIACAGDGVTRRGEIIKEVGQKHW